MTRGRSMVMGIAVVNYGSSALLADNLVASQREARSVDEDAVVVVVDNFSTGAERDRLLAMGAEFGWTIIASAENPGFGDGANIGMNRAFEMGASEVLLLNPDARIDGPSLAALRDELDGRRLAIVAPVILSGDGRVWFEGADLYLADGETRSVSKRSLHPGADTVSWLTGACMLITKEVFDVVGSFDSSYFLYWEDVDLSWRALHAGADLIVVQTARAVHDAGGTQEQTGRRGKSRTYYFYNARNRLLFAAENLSPDRMRAWLRTTPRVTWRILMRGGRAQLLRDPGVVWAALRGALEGRRLVKKKLRVLD